MAVLSSKRRFAGSKDSHPQSRTTAQLGRGRRRGFPALAVLCASAAFLLVPSAASATSADFCGRLVGSASNYSKACTGYLFTSWEYVSNRYNGAGSITTMGAVLVYGNGQLYYYERIANNATFVSACYYPVSSDPQNYPAIRQYEANGASHTLYGGADDSPNHTNCMAEFPV